MSRIRSSESVRRGLIVFMRYPEAGKVKSRLAAGIGKEQALLEYKKLVRRTLGIAGDLKQLHPQVGVFIFFYPWDKRRALESGYPGPWEFVPQEGSHLGERMHGAIRSVLNRGYDQTLLVGTDIANLEVHDLAQAFEALDHGYAPLGPARDGGFYLIGLDRPCPAVFQSSEWGTNRIFARTKDLLAREGLQVRELAVKKDIDRPEDLPFLRADATFTSTLSIIIPTLSPIHRLAPVLDRLQTHLWPNDEIIVAGVKKEGACEGEGGTPRTRYVVSSRKGRGLQLNCGAKAAKGDIFLFLHDDCTLPEQFAYSARKIASAPNVSLGCFQLAFSPSNPSLDMIARWANLRTRMFGLPYGDQGLFCRRETFEEIGGFQTPFLLEDVDFVQRCKKRGGLLKIPSTIHTSPQRYLREGILRASLKNHMIELLHHMGVDNGTLYAIYYNTRNGAKMFG